MDLASAMAASGHSSVEAHRRYMRTHRPNEVIELPGGALPVLDKSAASDEAENSNHRDNYQKDSGDFTVGHLDGMSPRG